VVDAAGADTPTSMQQQEPQARGGDGGGRAQREVVNLDYNAARDHHQELVDERCDGEAPSEEEHLP
jgi:hypothetical protein